MEYYKIHKAASLVPLATKEEQEALRADIELNGQQQPIALYRGKIVDGRNRQNACIELGISVDAMEIPNNMTLKEVENYVKSVNTRRNLTGTQKAITAFKEHNDKNISIADAARRWGIGRNYIYDAKFINTHRPTWLDILFNGGKIEFVDATTNKAKKGTSLPVIRKAIEQTVTIEEEPKAHQGRPEMARAFDQIKSAINFLPEGLSLSDKVYILRKTGENLIKGEL